MKIDEDDSQYYKDVDVVKSHENARFKKQIIKQIFRDKQILHFWIQRCFETLHPYLGTNSSKTFLCDI